MSLDFNAFIQKDVQTGLWHWHNHQDRASDETKNILMAAQRGWRLLVVSEYYEYAPHSKVTTCSVTFWSEICVSTGILTTVLYLRMEIIETLGIMYNLYFIYNLFMKCICSSVFCMWCIMLCIVASCKLACKYYAINLSLPILVNLKLASKFVSHSCATLT